MNTAILAVNAGSSSLKFAVYEDVPALTPIARGEVSGIGGNAHMRAQRLNSDIPAVDEHQGRIGSAGDALDATCAWIDAHCAQIDLSTIGHRVVHGGVRFHGPIAVDDAILDELEKLDPLAPQHQPHNLAAIRTLRRRFPRAAQIACFDTAFHAGWDDAAQRIALPRRFHDAGVRRYGFHGLSYEFLAGRVAALAPQASRVVLAHLGSGASMCAMRDGVSVDATMGFSVLDGLPMATRSGAIDPGVVFHLQRSHALDFDAIEHLLYYDSGLKGVSGISADARVLLNSDQPEAAQAIALFVRHCTKSIGALAAELGGIDALVFSGGIGARAPSIRAHICARLGFLGIQVDTDQNIANAESIGTAGSIPVLALITDEEIVIARHCRSLRAPTA